MSMGSWLLSWLFLFSIVYVEMRVTLEKKGNIIVPNDLIIVATVLANAGKIVTNNVEEFERVNGLIVEDWTK